MTDLKFTSPRRIPACESVDGNDRTEKDCAECGMTKITVHGAQGFLWREWRTKAGETWMGESTPSCLPVAGPSVDVASETSAEVVGR